MSQSDHPHGRGEDYRDIAGVAWADWLFMIGLAGIGAVLVLGIGMRAAAVAGAILPVLVWTAVLPPENNPFMDDHLIYALVLGVRRVRCGAFLRPRWLVGTHHPYPRPAFT